MDALQVAETLTKKHFAGEQISHVFLPKFGFSALVFTNARIFGIDGAIVAFSIPFAKLTSIGCNPLGEVTLFADGQKIAIAQLTIDPDLQAFRDAANSRGLQTFDAQPQAEAASNASATAKNAKEQRQVDFDRSFPNTQIFGSAPRGALLEAMEKSSVNGESPWLLINSGGGAGALFAFEDRLVIAKVGALTSFMADSFGAGRVSTLPFTQITGIEYNGGMASGVLEVLTPSYQGTKNQDFWRGTGAKRNTDRNSPWTLSNTLPLGVSDYKKAESAINELRSKIIAFQRPSVTVTSTPAPAQDLAGQIGNLKKLLDQGVLTEAEFQQAKQKLLG